jgi:hypothetical protein
MDKKVNLSLVIHAVMKDDKGDLMFQTPSTPYEYHNLSYADAVKIQRSLAQAISEHGERTLQMGDARAAELAAK